MKTKARSFLFAVAALAIAASTAHATGSWTIGVNGGVSKGTGDFGKESKVGPLAGIDVCLNVNDRFAVGVEGSWTQNSHKDVGTVVDFGGGDTYTLDKLKLKDLSGGVLGKFTFPAGGGRIAPFALVGIGFYNIKEDYQETLVLGGTTFVNTDESDGAKAETRFGGKFGAGAMYKATEKVGVTLQAELNIVTIDTAGAPAGTPSTVKFIGVRAGLNFHLMKY